MLTTEINPAGFAPEYLACLNACFPGWGSEATYQWCFERPMAGLTADQLVLRLDGKAVAGSAVSYRTVGLPDGRVVKAGIMTGSWTLPESRRQGCFARIVTESIDLAANRDCAMLLAFVTEDNGSCSQLRRAGAEMIPGYYVFSDPDTPVPSDPCGTVSVDTADVPEMLRTLDCAQSNRMRFVYCDPCEFTSQFLARPARTDVVRTGDGSLAVVERAADTDRVQLLLSRDEQSADATAVAIRDLLRHAIDSGRKLFLYTTSDITRDGCLAVGMRVKSGYMTLLPTPECPTLPDTGWDVQSGDRI